MARRSIQKRERFAILLSRVHFQSSSEVVAMETSIARASALEVSALMDVAQMVLSIRYSLFVL